VHARIHKLWTRIMEATKVGLREFRADLAEYIASSTPVAITWHGQTVGYVVPTQGQVYVGLAVLRKPAKRWTSF